MAPNRRDFLRSTATAGVALGMGVGALPSEGSGAPSGRPRDPDDPRPTSGLDRQVAPQRLLILGGTGFIGPHMVEYALSRGHTVTVFNRGPHEHPTSSPMSRSWWAIGTAT